jgi:hypothetical protein
MVKAGVDFSHKFRFGAVSSPEDYATTEDPLFVDGQVHYTKWCSQGHQVCILILPHGATELKKKW